MLRNAFKAAARAARQTLAAPQRQSLHATWQSVEPRYPGLRRAYRAPPAPSKTYKKRRPTLTTPRVFVGNPMGDSKFKHHDPRKQRPEKKGNIKFWRGQTRRFNKMLGECAALGSNGWEQGEKILMQMDNERVWWNVFTYTIMIRLYRMDKQWEKALEMYQEMRVAKQNPNEFTCSTLFAALKEGGAPWQAANDVYKQLGRRGPLNEVAYNALLSHCDKELRWQRSLELFEDMKQRNVAPDTITYNILINTMTKAGELGKAEALFRELERSGLGMTVHTYTTFINTCAKAGRWKRALELFDALRSDQLQPTEVTYSALINTFAQAGKWERALEVFSDMQQAGFRPAVLTYNNVLTALQIGGQWEKAAQVFEEMRGAGVTADVNTFTAMIGAFGAGGEWARAEAAFQDIEKAGLAPSIQAYKALIAAMVTGLQWEAVPPLLRKLKLCGLRADVDVYHGVVHAAAAAGRWEKVVMVLREMRHTGGASADVRTLNALISARMHAAGVEPRQVTHEYIAGVRDEVGLMGTSGLLHGVDQHPCGQRSELILGELSVPAAEGVLRLWLQDLHVHPPPADAVSADALTAQCGAHNRLGVARFVEEVGAPFRMDEEALGLMHSTRQEVKEWLEDGGGLEMLRSFGAAPARVPERTPAPAGVSESTPAPAGVSESTPAPAGVSESTPAPARLSEQA